MNPLDCNLKNQNHHVVLRAFETSKLLLTDVAFILFVFLYILENVVVTVNMSLHHGDKPSWPDTVQMLTEKLSLDNLPHQVSSCRGMEEKVEKVLNNLTEHKKISGWLSA